ncbi:MAG: type II toxin-antitoxin system RelE/ParE family toxin [Oscillospiraceae bacterium]|nr:type II toxin-antitoxin system RelE/ParE family toxin [Oscillospiraceae bacterium]
MKIHVTPLARHDLREIEAYIKESYDNPTAAKRVAQKIIKSYKLLKTNPWLGVSLRLRYGIDTPVNMLISGKYLVFYEIEEDAKLIKIISVLHSKQDAVKKRFPDFQYDYDIDEEDLEHE